jgi:hypothetical protein
MENNKYLYFVCRFKVPSKLTFLTSIDKKIYVKTVDVFDFISQFLTLKL